MQLEIETAMLKIYNYIEENGPCLGQEIYEALNMQPGGTYMYLNRLHGAKLISRRKEPKRNDGAERRHLYQVRS